MRVALVTDSLFAGDSAGRGATTTIKAVADRLLETGHDVCFIAPGPGLTSYKRSRIVRVSPLAKPGGQVRAALEAFSPDVVQVVNPGRLGRKALKHGRALGVRTVVLQQSPVTEATADYWRSRVADRADSLVVTAHWMVERLSHAGITAGYWAPGVDAAAFSPAMRDERLHDRWARVRHTPTPGGLVVVGYVGALTKSHGVRQLAALNLLRGIRPVIVGDGAQRSWLYDRLPSAAFSGALSNGLSTGLGTGELGVAMASLDVLVHPGQHEASGHVLREAAASGLPIVAPRSGAALDVVRHLETGMLYEPDDAWGLPEAVAAVVADPQRRMLGAQGREQVRDRDWATAVDELVERHYRRRPMTPVLSGLGGGSGTVGTLTSP